jgi:parallel beta-helix repeat protein
MKKYSLMGKGIAVGIILLFIGTSVIPITAQEIEKPSLPTSRGDWLYVGGSGPWNYTKIQDAIDNASDGDTVFVYQGTYYENVDIDKIIYLLGEDKNFTVIDGRGKKDVICVHNDNAGLIVSGFTIQNSGNYSDGYTEDCGVDVLSNNNTIENNIITHHPLHGIRVGLANNNTLRKNIILNNPNDGIWIDYSDNNIIVNNIIFNNTYSGIRIDDGKKNSISNNILTYNFLGVTISTLSSGNLDNIISNNTISNNSVGVDILRAKTFVYRNNFLNNTQYNATQHAQVLLCRCTWEGNYWDDWIGLKSAVLSLFPKHIMSGLNFDWHPAHQPYEVNSVCPIYHEIDSKQGLRDDSIDKTAVVKKPVFYTSPEPTPLETPSSFSWMDYNGEDYTTPAKNQGKVGSCWAFAALGALESVIKIRENCSALNPDLSEQYLMSCLPKIREENNVRPFFWIMNTSAEGNYCNGVTTEACFPYVIHLEVPPSHIHPDWKDHLIPILDFWYWIPDKSPRENREIIKTQIMQKGPVTALIEAQLLFKKWGYSHHSPTDYYPHIPSIWRLMGKWGGLHLLMILGWKDNPLIPSGGYWICKNSWGASFGYDGFCNLAYGALGIGDVIYPIDPIYMPYIGWVDYDPESVDWPPIADAGGNYHGNVGQEILFNASGSVDADGDIISCLWDFGDGTYGAGNSLFHVYGQLGVYSVILTVTDQGSNMGTDTTSATINT